MSEVSRRYHRKNMPQNIEGWQTKNYSTDPDHLLSMHEALGSFPGAGVGARSLSSVCVSECVFICV